MDKQSSLALIAQQKKAARILGPLYERIIEIFPVACWFYVDVDFKQISFVPKTVFNVTGHELGRLHQATKATAMVVKSIRTAPGDKGLRPFIVLIGIDIP